MFCEVKLASLSVKVRQKKYCDTCRTNPKVKRYLQNLYHRRWKQKKKGLAQEPVVKKKVVYSGRGRKPVKSIIPDDEA